MKNLLPGGFGELTPEKQIIENSIKNIIIKNYQRFWYVNIETPAVELNEVLTSKGWEEVGKQIFWLYGLKQWAQDLKQYSLHFDLTVPLARYVVDNEESLKFPFKRYQIQKVWRWERQQRGRFKEFTQADIDVIGNELPLNYDSEVILSLYRTLKEIFEFLDISKWVEVHLNNKKFIEWICQNYGITGENKTMFFALLDGFYKSTREDFETSLQELVWENFSEINTLLNTKIEDLDDTNAWISQGINELKQVYNSLKQKWVNVVFDPYITRGLDYYTGTVFETFISEYFNFGSVCSGWRFDNLVEDIRKVANGWKETNRSKSYGWVWGSIWLSRLFARLEEWWFINKKIPLTQTIIFNTAGSNWEYREKISEILRNSGISTDIYYLDEKLGKQFTYAESKNIPFWIFAWADEQDKNEVIVKNLDSRDQENVSIENLAQYIKDKLEEIFQSI